MKLIFLFFYYFHNWIRGTLIQKNKLNIFRIWRAVYPLNVRLYNFKQRKLQIIDKDSASISKSITFPCEPYVNLFKVLPLM